MLEKLFPLGGPVSEKDIVDREDFLNSLQTRLNGGQSVMLAGPRRIGKTSLALEVLRRLKKQGLYTAFVDLFRVSSRHEFALSMIDSCLENRTGIRKTAKMLVNGVKAVTGSAKLILKVKDLEIDFHLLDKEQNENELLDYALELPDNLAKKDKKRMVVVFDEFQEAPRLADENIYKRMRAHFQLPENVSYLFLGSKESLMKAIFSDSKQAFYRFTTTLPIPPVPEDSWKEYITGKFREARIEIDEESIKEIIRLTGGHPQDTMLVCSETYHFLLEAGAGTLSLESVRVGYERALSALSSLFDKMLDDLYENPHALRTLKRIAQGSRVYSKKEHPNETKRAVDYLIARTVIEKSGRGSYRFVEPMFQDYVRREFF